MSKSDNLPGVQWIPSNNDSGHGFLCAHCSTCARDKAFREGVDIDECGDDEKCEIIGASFRGEAIQWRELSDGQLICTSYVEHGKPIPPEPCSATVDMFKDAKP